MRVLVTGGTGFLGSHSVKALLDAGHDVRLLVRSPARIGPAMAPHGIGDVDHVVGDVTDADSVARAVEGCDAVLHTANVYTLDPRRAQEMLDVNPRGTGNVLRAAHERGLDPIVHVSSNAALLPSAVPLTPESPLGDPPGAYSQSKVAAERIAREMQQQGAPVVIINPVGLLGPFDPHMGDFTSVARDVLAGKMPLVPAGMTPVVDVRDVAAVHAALMRPGTFGGRRYIVAGGHVTLKDFAEVAAEVTGRRIPAVMVPGKPLLAAGKAADAVARTLRVRLPVNFEGPWFMVHGAPADASAVERDLGVRFRPPRGTLADTYRWLVDSGHVAAKKAGRLAPA